MALYTRMEREEHKARVRGLILMNPSMPLTVVRDRLAKANIPLEISYDYLIELGKEIRAERIERIENETKEDIYAYLSEIVEFVNQNLRAIAQEEKLVYTKTKDGVPTESPETRIFAQNNRIKALNSVVDNTIKLYNLKMDLGIIERKVGTMDHNIIDVMSALKKIRNGNYTTPLRELIPSPQISNTGQPA